MNKKAQTVTFVIIGLIVIGGFIYNFGVESKEAQSKASYVGDFTTKIAYSNNCNTNFIPVRNKIYFDSLESINKYGFSIKTDCPI